VVLVHSQSTPAAAAQAALRGAVQWAPTPSCGSAAHAALAVSCTNCLKKGVRKRSRVSSAGRDACPALRHLVWLRDTVALWCRASVLYCSQNCSQRGSSHLPVMGSTMKLVPAGPEKLPLGLSPGRVQKYTAGVWDGTRGGWQGGVGEVERARHGNACGGDRQQSSCSAQLGKRCNERSGRVRRRQLRASNAQHNALHTGCRHA
jgi:hypothetical protein